LNKLSPLGGEKIDNNKHLINDGDMQLQKEVKSNPKQPN